MTEDEEDHALDALRLTWGSRYELGVGLDGFWARRRDGLGGEILAAEPDDLHRLIGVDEETCPVRGIP